MINTQKKQHKKQPKNYVYKTIKSPIGVLKLVASDDGLAAILWENDNPHRVQLNIVAEDESHPTLVETERQLGEYFAGNISSFFGLYQGFIQAARRVIS